MKPQCNTSAECLRELARVMDQFGFSDHFAAVSSKYVKENGRQWDYRVFPEFTLPSSWQFALAEVEGKPVFPYQDGLYAIGGGRFIPASAVPTFRVLSDENGYTFGEAELTWTPPRPKTVTVELTVEDAEQLASHRIYEHMQIRIQDACKKALEQIK